MTPPPPPQKANLESVIRILSTSLTSVSIFSVCCYSRYLSQYPHPAQQGTFAANTNFVTVDTVHVGEKENQRLFNYK
jgi:hypothetical protein